MSSVAARYFGRPVAALAGGGGQLAQQSPLPPPALPANAPGLGGQLSMSSNQTLLTSEPAISSLLLNTGSSQLVNPVMATDRYVIPGPSVSEVALGPGSLTDGEKPIVVELAVAELLRMIHCEEPVWTKGGGRTGGGNGMDEDELNPEEYFRLFPGGIGPRPYGLRTEASRDAGLVIMNGGSLVETLMDAVRGSLCVVLENVG